MGTTSRSESARFVSPADTNVLSHAATRTTHGGTSPLQGRTGLNLEAATDADHPAIHRLLRAVLQRPSAVAFQSLNDAPQYEPTDRLLVKQQDHVVAHVHLTPRTLKFGAAEVRSTDLRHLATLPEYREAGLASRLLHNALDDMRQNGSVIATTNTPLPKVYRQRGWVTCGWQSRSSISPRDLLAHLESSKTRPEGYPRPPKRHVCVRHWRQHEIDQISSMYDHSIERSYGPLLRRQSHWRWLMSRPCTYDQAYVAFESDRPCSQADEQGGGKIVGYSVMRGDFIIELATVPGDTKALRRLMARACHDAIENGRCEVGLSAPVDHPAHELIVAAGGRFSYQSHTDGREIMAKVLDEARFLQMLKPELWERAKEAGLESGQSVTFNVEGERKRFTINKRSIGIGNDGEGYDLALSRDQFMRLLLGCLHLDDELRRGSIRCESEIAVNLTNRLFPRLPFWRPQLDDVCER